MQGSGQPPKLVPANLGRLKAYLCQEKETHVGARQGVSGQGLSPHAGISFGVSSSTRLPWSDPTHSPGWGSRPCVAGSSVSPSGPAGLSASMDRSSPFSSQSRSFRFLFEPIKASTEKACARELRATADLLLSLIFSRPHPGPLSPALY